MLERLLICDECEEPYFLNKALLKDFVDDGSECRECGSPILRDYGWCENEVPHDCAELLNDMDAGQVDCATH